MSHASHNPAPSDETGACGGPGRSRRDVLAIAGLGVVGGGVLAACGGGSSASPAGTTTQAAPGTSAAGAPSSASASNPASTSDAATSAASASAEATSAAPTSAGGFTVPTSEIPVGGGKIFKNKELVVTQPTAGSFKAFSAVCPHQGCIVYQIDNKKIICPCHASMFDIATGAVLSGPAQTGLAPEQASVAGGSVTVQT